MYLSIKKEEWDSYLLSLALGENFIYAPHKTEKFVDFDILSENPQEIIYHSYKTLTPIKHFLFTIKEKITDIPAQKKIILIGAKACDLAALDLLDKVFLDEDYPDPYYKTRRDNTIIIGTDCYEISENCHCTAYGIDPYVEKNCDLTVNVVDDNVLIKDLSEKGEKFIRQMKENSDFRKADNTSIKKIKRQQQSIKNK